MNMDSRSQILLQILDKLGVPLMKAAYAQTTAQAGPDDAGQKEAQAVAALLSETVKISIGLSQAMNLKPEDGNPDSIRIALAALAANLIADISQKTGRLPGEQESRRITKVMESVLAFSDHFAPAAEHASRLRSLGNGPVFFDPAQAALCAMNGLVPVISAVAAFPFGQSETKLIQDIAARLSAKAEDMRGTLLNEMADEAAEKFSALVILQALGQIYAAIHREETSKLLNQPQADQGQGSLEPVWAEFEKQAAMLGVILSAVAGDETVTGASGRGGKTVKPAAAAPAEETPAAAPPPAAPPKGSNPMAFFKPPGGKM